MRSLPRWVINRRKSNFEKSFGLLYPLLFICDDGLTLILLSVRAKFYECNKTCNKQFCVHKYISV